MELITGTTAWRIREPSCVAIGKFDGIHIGHRTLIKRVMEAGKEGLKTVIFTFSPSPQEFFSDERIPELMTASEKRKAFEEAGIDVLWEFPMNRFTAAMDPVDFIKDILVERLHAKLIVAGDDISFGCRGAGDAKLLARYAKEYDYEVNLIDKICLFGKTVSSTYVRNEVRTGHMEDVTSLLGKPYSFRGKVLHGKKLGRKLQMPTVNLIPEEGKLFPPFGVYYAYVSVDETIYCGIANIGRKPTVNDSEAVGVETYLYDFEGNLYGKEIEVSLLSYKRPEKRFESVEALAEQLVKDREDGRSYFTTHPLKI